MPSRPDDPATDTEIAGVDLAAEHLADSAFWAAPPEHRHRVFAALREHDPVRWYEPRVSGFSRACTGFWALTRYEDVWNASRNAKVYCSGVTIDIEEMPEELGEFFPSMINLDDPEHFRLRRMVSAGFTPKEIAAIEPKLRATARHVVDDVIERFGDGTEFDLVTELSARLPLAAIADLMGVPAEDQQLLFDWTNAVVSPDDPATGVAGAADASRALAGYAQQLGAQRRARPADDLTSALMHAEIDGQRLSTKEYANFFILLTSAGNETTRNAITHGVRLLTAHPDQRRVWFDDFDAVAPTAVEEIVRFETLISNMCRVLTEDVVIQGVPIAAGEKVALWYTSANRDHRAFPDPDRFDVRRPVHPQQVGYGGGGPHFCLGANLARKEMTVMFDEVRRRIPDLHVTGQPTRVLSMGLNSITHVAAAVR